MKIAMRAITDKPVAGFLSHLSVGFVIGFLGFSTSCLAADPVPVGALPIGGAASPVATASAVAPAAPAATPAVDQATQIPPPPSIAEASAAPAAHEDGNEDRKIDKSLRSLENKVIGDVKDVARKLGSTAGDMSLEDLNTAKVALAKIDTLIDIEKHLTELERVRQDRTHEASSTSIPQVSVSAFQAPQVTIPTRTANDDSDIAASASATDFSVERILGAGGQYAAIVVMSNGQSKTVRVGDKVAGNILVTDITSKKVEIQQGDKVRELSVKGVGNVYGRSL